MKKTRARISRDGIAVARQGYDVDTAVGDDMLITPVASLARLLFDDEVALTSFSQNRIPSGMLRGIVSYGKTYPRVPEVMVAGAVENGASRQTPFFIQGLITQQLTGTTLYTGFSIPWYTIQMRRDGFTLYAINPSLSGQPERWRYWVFENTIES